ncbi:hypothetical protein [Lysobacter olei]
MTQDKDQGPIRLVPLVSAGEGVDDREVNDRLLALCIERSVHGFARVPPGHVAVVYEHVNKQSERALFEPERTVITYKSGPAIDRQVKYVGLDKADLREVRDSGEAVIEAFINDGFASWNAGLFPWPIKYCVIQRDRHNPFVAGSRMLRERLLEGLVYPVVQNIRLKDVLVTAEDGAALRSLLQSEVPDKWGHKVEAPSVFRVYQCSQREYDSEAIQIELLKDQSGVFTKAGAEASAMIIKQDVRGNAVKGIAVKKITNNEVGKDYSDASLSKRMSLLLLATDCWIHDRALRDQAKTGSVNKRAELEVARKDPKTRPSRITQLEKELLQLEMAERESIRGRLYMPSGLDAYLEELGFRKNQVKHLRRIITGEKATGRHASTERSVAPGSAGGKARRK